MEEIAEESHQDHVHFINCEILKIGYRFHKLSNFIISVTLFWEAHIDCQIDRDKERGNRDLFRKYLLNTCQRIIYLHVWQ